MEQLYHQFEIREFRKNHIIYKENEDALEFFFIKSGEIEVYILLLKNYKIYKFLILDFKIFSI